VSRQSELALKTAIVAPPSAFEGDAFKVVPHAGSKQLAIFMSASGAKPGSFNFVDAADELPANRLFLNNGGRNEWYQGGVPGLGDDVDQTLHTLSLWARYLGAEEIVVVGQGMGAHGAILYGTQLGARVLAFSPETTLKLPASRSERLMAPDASIRHQNLHGFVRAAEQPVTVIAGERDPVELYCMSLATALPNFQGRTLRRVGHDIPAYLHGRRLLVPLLQAFLAGEPLPPLQQDGNALRHEGFATYFYALHVAHDRKEWNAAIRIGREVTKQNLWSDHAHYLLGLALMQEGDHAEALRAFALADAILPDQPNYRFNLATCFKKLGDYDQAIAIHRKSMQAFPRFAKPSYDLSLIYMQFGLYAKAQTFAAKAAKIEPANKGYAAHVKKIKARVQKGAQPGDISEEAVRMRAVYGA
jgi:tetratricopeptide (TPR) repeat protein